MINEVVVLGSLQMRDGASLEEYSKLREEMLAIVTKIDGFQSVKRYTAEDGETINIYRFASEKSLETWRNHPEHRKTMKRGHTEFYSKVYMQICKVIREVDFQRNRDQKSTVL